MASRWSAASMAFAIVLGIGLSALTGVFAEDEACNKPVMKVPFMKTPVSQEDLGKLLTPVWGMLNKDGGGSGGGMSSMKEDVMNYLKKYSMQPIAGVVAMFAITLLSLLVFLLWRFLRCICVWCCQQEAYADGAKVLTSRGFRGRKVAMLVLGLIGMAVAAWGMASVDKDFPKQVGTEFDKVAEFPGKLVSKVESVASSVTDITKPLEGFTGIVDAINIPKMSEDLRKIQDFFTNGPTPDTFTAPMNDLTAPGTGSVPKLLDALESLKSSISTEAGQGFGDLRSNLQKLVALDLTGMAGDIAAYKGSITTVQAMTSPATNTAQYMQLRSSQDTMHGPGVGSVQSWVDSVEDCKDASSSLQNLTPNPFNGVSTTIASVALAIADVKTDLDGLKQKVLAFNDQWKDTVNVSVGNLINKAEYIDQKVVSLASYNLNTLSTSRNQVNTLYEDTMQGVPNKIDNIISKFDSFDTSVLDSSLQTAQTQFDQMDFSSIYNNLGDLATALTAFQTSVGDLDTQMGAYETNGAGAWGALQTQLGTTGQAADTAATGIATANSGGGLSHGSSVLGPLDGLGAQSDLIVAAEQSVNDADLSGMSSTLGSAGGFGSGVTAMLADVGTMLEKMGSLGTDAVQTANDQVEPVKAQINDAVDQIKTATTGQLNKMKAKYIVSDEGGGDTPVLEKFWPLAYKALVGLYGLVMVFMVLVFLFTYLNWPAGVCFFSFLLNIVLILFALIPIFYTIFMVLLRDSCANLEYVGLQAVDSMFNPGDMPYDLANYYLSPDGHSADIGEIVGKLTGFDISQLKGDVRTKVDDAMQQATQGFTPKEEVQAVLDKVKLQVDGTLSEVDGLLALLGYDEVHPVIMQVKGWICCDLTQQLYVQWVSCLVLLAFAWVAMVIAMTVLKKLDGLSDSCCACSCFNARDYEGEGKYEARTSKDAADEVDPDTVAVITMGGKPGDKKQLEAPDSHTPLPAPLQASATPLTAPKMDSPRMYPSIDKL